MGRKGLVKMRDDGYLATGLAALVELAAEPMFILAQLQLNFRLRVATEAAATLAKGLLTLALLRLTPLSDAIALSLAQAWVYTA